MFKNALVFQIEHWAPPTLPEMESRLDAARFVECGATQPESAGWVAPRGDKHAALAESVGGQVILKLCTETKAVPGGGGEDPARSRARQDRTGHRPPAQGQEGA
jgi:recombination associated protein RdgC